MVLLPVSEPAALPVPYNLISVYSEPGVLLLRYTSIPLPVPLELIFTSKSV